MSSRNFLRFSLIPRHSHSRSLQHDRYATKSNSCKAHNLGKYSKNYLGIFSINVSQHAHFEDKIQEQSQALRIPPNLCQSTLQDITPSDLWINDCQNKFYTWSHWKCHFQSCGKHVLGVLEWLYMFLFFKTLFLKTLLSFFSRWPPPPPPLPNMSWRHTKKLNLSSNISLMQQTNK